MPIPLPLNYVAELKKGTNSPNIILEIALDTETKKLGYSDGGFPDVISCVKSVSSFQSKIDYSKSISSKGNIKAVIVGKDNISPLIGNHYLKNRRVTVKSGFITGGNSAFAYADYANIFTGKITDWKRDGHELTLTISDDLYDTKKKLPVENTSGTQYKSFVSINPVSAMLRIMQNTSYLAIDSTYINSTAFVGERDEWISNWKFERYITEPTEAMTYLNELQVETNSFIFNDGKQITYKVFSPALPGQTSEGWTDEVNFLADSLTVESGYSDNFFNKVVVYFDWMQDGDGTDDYESVVIALDANSQSSTVWNETNTKTIKSKWIKSISVGQPSWASTDIVITHASKQNSIGNGQLRYSQANKTLEWMSPGSTYGATVDITETGQYNIYDSDESKWVRVIVLSTSLSTAISTATITLSQLHGNLYATVLSERILTRFRDPVTVMNFDIDMNDASYDNTFIKPTDIKLITSDLISDKGKSTWSDEKVMITSIKPDWDKSKISIEAVPTRLYRNYGFIAPAGFPDYSSASSTQKEFGFIGDSSNHVGVPLVIDGYYIF